MFHNYAPGDRVFAIIEGDDKTVRMLGLGTYAGDFVPPGADWKRMTRDEALAKALRLEDETERKQAIATVENMTDKQFEEAQTRFEELFVLTPRIDLDTGGHVWGCEVWWGPIEQMDRAIGGRVVTNWRPVRDETGQLVKWEPADTVSGEAA